MNIFSLRLVPQDQDTGGFFIAVLRKKPLIELTLNLKNSVTSRMTETTSDKVDVLPSSKNTQQIKEEQQPPVKKHCRRDGFPGENFILMPRDSEDLLSIK